MKPITTRTALKSILLMTGVCIAGTTVGCSFHAGASAKAGGASSGSGSAKTSSSGSAKTSSSGSAKTSSSGSANSSATADAKASATASGAASSSGHLSASASAGGAASEKTKVRVKSKPKVTGMGCASGKPDFKAAIILKGKAKGGISVRGGASATGSASADAHGAAGGSAAGSAKTAEKTKTADRKPEETRKPAETTVPEATAEKTRPGKPNPRRETPPTTEAPAPEVEKTRPGKPNPRRETPTTTEAPAPVVEKTRPGKPNPRRRVPQAEDPAPQEPITPPEEPPENDFGYEVPVRGCFEGLVYPLQPGARKLPGAFDRLEPVSVVYACEWDIPERSWSSGFPGVDDLFEWFAIRYTGAFAVERPGSYRFRVSSDDGMKLFIDGKLVINNDGVHPPAVKDGRIELTRGDHQMVLEYFQGPRYLINLQLYATPPGGEEGLFSVR